jgi:hypothetical protein
MAMPQYKESLEIEKFGQCSRPCYLSNLLQKTPRIVRQYKLQKKATSQTIADHQKTYLRSIPEEKVQRK